jgi:pilus assembly protein CpaE
VSRTIRVIVLNTDEQVAVDLRAVLLSLEGVKIVAELDEPALLGQALNQFPAEVLLVHLDPHPAGMMDVVAPLLEPNKEKVAALAMTEDRDAELVMRAMRAGFREFLWKPFPPEQLGEVLDRSVNLSAEIAQITEWSGAGRAGTPPGASGAPARKPRTALVDLDFRLGQVAMQLDVQPTYTIAELCETPEQLDTRMIERAMCRHPSGVHVLSRPLDWSQAERISAGQCAGALASLQEHYDFVVVDLPPRFDPTARAVFDMADDVLLLLQLLVPSVRNTDRMLQELGRSGYALERLKVVCNRFGREAGYLEPSDVEATLKRKFDFCVPDDWKTLSTAINMGAPLLTYAPKSKLRLAFQQMAQLLTVREEAAVESVTELDPKKKGLFSFLVGSAPG